MRATALEEARLPLRKDQALFYQDDLLMAATTKMTRQLLAGVKRGRPLAVDLSTTTKRPKGVETIRNRRALLMQIFCRQSRSVVQLLLVIHYIIFQPFVASNTFSVAEGGSASAPASSMADPQTNLSYASAASGVSSVSNDTSGSGFAPNEQGRSSPSSLEADFLLSPQFSKAFERYAHQRGDPSGNAASASADDDKGDGGDWIDGDSHDDFPSPDPYVEATFTKYQEFINVTIASHFHHDPSRCRSLLAALATALVRYFCRPPSVEAQAARNKCMLSLIYFIQISILFTLLPTRILASSSYYYTVRTPPHRQPLRRYDMLS